MALLNVRLYGKSGKVPNKKKKSIFVGIEQKPRIDIQVGQLWKSSKKANVYALIKAVIIKDDHKMISYSYFEYDELKYHTVLSEKNFRSDFDMKSR